MAVNTQARMQFSLQDGQGIKASLAMPLIADDAQTLAQAKTAWTAQAALLNAVTGAAIIRGSVDIILPATAGAVVADSRVEEVGNLDYNVTGTPYVYDSIVPAIRDTVLTAGGTQIDEANAAMAAYIASISAAVLGGNFTNHDFLVLTTLRDSFLSFRRRQRALHQRSVRFP